MISGLAFLAAVAFLAALGALGTAVLRRARLGLTLLEEVAYGAPLGVSAVSLALVPLAIIVGFGAGLVAVTAVVSGGAAVLLWPDRPPLSALPLSVGGHPFGIVGRAAPRSPMVPARARFVGLRQVRPRFGMGSALAVGGLGFLGTTFCLGAMSYESDGLWVGQQHIWSDWPLHLSHTLSFAEGDNFPPMLPQFAGHPFAYHYLTSLTAAGMVVLGMDPVAALEIHTLVFSLLIGFGLYTFAHRLTLTPGAAVLTVALFLVGGGLDWVTALGGLNSEHGSLSALWREPFAYDVVKNANFRWETTFVQLLVPTRGFLYGLPLALLIFTLLHLGMETGRQRLFAVAGVAAGLTPFAHLGTLQALALITPFLFLLRPSRNWLVFGTIWVALAAPQLYLQQGGDRGAAEAIRWHVGWLAGDDPIWWFWLKNLGWFLPLLLLALADRVLLPMPTRRFLWAFMPAFVFANLVVFQPLELDNNKILAYWFLAVCVLTAALLAKTWQTVPVSAVRGLVVLVTAGLVLSGLLIHLDQLLGRDQYRLLGTEDLAIAAAVRTNTQARAVFVTAPDHNHPVSTLGGRRVLTTWSGWLYHWGIDGRQRAIDLQEIYELTPDAPGLMAKYGVDYVVIGPREREELNPNVEAFRARYPVVIHRGEYEVFDVRPGAS